MAVFLFMAAMLNALGLLLILESDRLSKSRLMRDGPFAEWLGGTVPIAIGGAMVFLGVILAVIELMRR